MITTKTDIEIQKLFEEIKDVRLQITMKFARDMKELDRMEENWAEKLEQWQG